MPAPRTRRPANPIDRLRVRRAAALWRSTALGSVLLLAAAAIWHLARRGGLIRDRLVPPKGPGSLG